MHICSTYHNKASQRAAQTNSSEDTSETPCRPTLRQTHGHVCECCGFVERQQTASTHRNDHSILPLEFGDIFIPPGELRVVERSESAHHFNAALRRVPHVDASGELQKMLSNKINPETRAAPGSKMFTLLEKRDVKMRNSAVVPPTDSLQHQQTPSVPTIHYKLCCFFLLFPRKTIRRTYLVQSGLPFLRIGVPTLSSGARLSSARLSIRARRLCHPP